MQRTLLVCALLANFVCGPVYSDDKSELIENPPDYRKVYDLDKSDLEEATPEEVDVIYGNADSVSMVEVLANPSSFDGREVQFFGVLSNEREGTAIYLDIESYEYSIPQNAIFLLGHNTDDSVLNELEGQYVWIIGTFFQDSASHNFPTSGHLQWIAPLSWSSARQVRRSGKCAADEP